MALRKPMSLRSKVSLSEAAVERLKALSRLYVSDKRLSAMLHSSRGLLRECLAVGGMLLPSTARRLEQEIETLYTETFEVPRV